MSAPSTAATNRLAHESSPYLLLHQHNPVDWYPWGPEALERARREDKPIFLSVGYSTCYWCHVMERESFSDPAVAELMNREFVNVKLDREERPDLDEIYMTATQILSGQGGWPNSVFLTPQLKPFYAGTYFPPDDRYGRPGFRRVLEDLATAYRSRRKDVEEQAEEMARAMRHYLEERAQPTPEPPSGAVAARAFESLAARFDHQWGGFGGAPKFPTPSNLYLLLELADERPEAGEMLAATLDQMARGGLYDQLGGGFHRYATDREWKIPHFEKMLYDNGFLLELYAREHARTGDPQAARVVRETAAWLAREMTSPEGAFWSAIDAETHGHEGAFYVWTREELLAALGDEDFTFLAPLLGFDGPPFFEGTSYVLHLPERLEAAASRRRMSPEALLADVDAGRGKLFASREKRQRPATDDKVLVDWNGIAIAGLAVAGRLLAEPALIESAARAARFILDTLWPAGGPLLHAWRQGQGRIPAYLTDYVFLVRGLLALHAATGEERWLRSAEALTTEQMERLRDPEGGFFVAGASPDLLFRTKEVFDGATPAGNAVAVLNLLELARLTGNLAWRGAARAALMAFGQLLESHPDAVRMMVVALRRYYETSGESEEADAVYDESRAAFERSAEAATAKLDREAADLVDARLELRDGAEAGWRPFRLVLEIEPGWHLQANPSSKPYLVATEIAAAGGELRHVHYPEGEPLSSRFSQEPIAVYAGRVEITGEVSGPGRLSLTYQPCDEARCLPPVRRNVDPVAGRLHAATEPLSAVQAVDHLLLGVADLDHGIEWVEKLTGVKAAIGGSHPGRGTRNALLSLGGRRYLEIIAPDPAQTAYNFQIDVRKLAEPRLVTWAAGTSDIDAVAKTARDAGYQLFGPNDGSRAQPDGKLLKWKSLGVQNAFGRDDVEPIPFFIQWAADSPHPSHDSPGGCELQALALEHPEAAQVGKALKDLGIDLQVRQAAAVRLTATLKTSKGEVRLS